MSTLQAARRTEPTRKLFDPKNPMPWVPSAATDVRATFERVRAEQKGGAR
jgi:hypothetical protein